MKRTGKEIAEAVFDGVTEITNCKREIFKIQAEAEKKIEALAKAHKSDLNRVRAECNHALDAVISSVSEKYSISKKHLKNVSQNY